MQISAVQMYCTQALIQIEFGRHREKQMNYSKIYFSHIRHKQNIYNQMKS